MSFDVVGFGALCLDKIITVGKIPVPGQETYLRAVETFPGGSSANTMAALAKLDMNVGYIGKTGSDEEGSLLIESMIYQGVDTRGIRVSEGKSGVCIILVDNDGERSTITDPGVNDEMDFRDVNISYLEGTKLLHMSYFTCRNSEKTLETQKKLAREARNLGIKMSFDPGHRFAEMGLEKIGDLIKYSNAVMLNEEEAKILTGLDYENAAGRILELGPSIVAVKLGSRGCYVATKTSSVSVPAFPVKAIDTTGAGDAFNAGFIYGILKQKSPEECGKMGNAVASFCVKKVGARDGLPSKEEFLHMGFTEKMGPFRV